MNNVQAEHIRAELQAKGQSPDAFVGFKENGAKFNINGKETEVEIDHERIADTNPEWERPIATARALVKAAVDGDNTFARKQAKREGKGTFTEGSKPAGETATNAGDGSGVRAATGTLNNDGAGSNVTAQPRGANTPKK